MANHLITVSNGLLDPEHVSRVGPAVWTYLCLIDWQTQPDGTVLDRMKSHGRGVRIQDIANRLGLPVRTIRSHLVRLRPYLELTRTREGFFIRIRNPHKRFKGQVRVAENGQSRVAENRQSHHPERQKSDTQSGRNQPSEWQKSDGPYIEEGQVSDKQGHAGQAEVLSQHPQATEKLRGMGAGDELIVGIIERSNGSPDGDIAEAVAWKDYQKSPKLFLQTVPENLARKKHSAPTAEDSRDAAVLRIMKKGRTNHADSSR